MFEEQGYVIALVPEILFESFARDTHDPSPGIGSSLEAHHLDLEGKSRTDLIYRVNLES
jgi:hypothetical protein